ncbi:MAG: WxL domain-containing protein [Patulibacter minatonensis]
MVLLVGLPGASQGAVAYRDVTCKVQTLVVTGTFTMNKPPTLQTGDVMIASVAASSLVAFNLSTPSGWTEMSSSDPAAKLYYKVATAAEPANYTFATILGVTATIVGSITAFSGVDNVAPIADTAKALGTGTTATFPSVHATRAGGALWTNAVSGGTLSSTFLAPLTKSCDQSGGGVSSATAQRTAGTGTIAGMTDSLSGSANWLAQSVMLQSASACTTGGLNLTPPTTVAFPATTLNGSDRTVTASATFTVADMTDTAAGWNLSATSTAFKNAGGQSLGNAATTITGLNVTAGSPNCGMPATSSATLPMTLPAGAVAPAAAKIYSSDAGTGLGAANLQYSFALALPGNIRTGAYASTWTFTLAAGP